MNLKIWTTIAMYKISTACTYGDFWLTFSFSYMIFSAPHDQREQEKGGKESAIRVMWVMPPSEVEKHCCIMSMNDSICMKLWNQSCNHPTCNYPACNHSTCNHPKCNHLKCYHPTCNHPRCNHPKYNRPTCNHPKYNHPTCNHPICNHPKCNHPRCNHPTCNHPAFSLNSHTFNHPTCNSPISHIPHDMSFYVFDVFSNVPLTMGCPCPWRTIYSGIFICLQTCSRRW